MNTHDTVTASIPALLAAVVAAHKDDAVTPDAYDAAVEAVGAKLAKMDRDND